MKKIFCLIMVLAVALCYGQFSLAAEHGGKEHGGEEHGDKEHGGKEHGDKEHGGEEHGKEHGGEEKGSKGSHGGPTAENIRHAMKDYVVAKSAKTGTLDIHDTKINKMRRLVLIRVHERVGKTGDYFYSCADFKDVDSGEMLDLDLDVEYKNGNLSVVDVRIHKVDGKERYTYDDNDNRIPLPQE